MKTLLIGINAKYIHTNLAIRYLLSECVKNDMQDISIKEFTINMQLENILADILGEKPQIVAFSCYIWNIDMVRKLICDIKKVDDKIKIILGGPEVCDEYEYLLKQPYCADFVIRGEGEKPFFELVQSLIKSENGQDVLSVSFLKDGRLCENELCLPLDLAGQKSVYETSQSGDLSQFENKIIYYESSRGCPYNCGYCLSSSTKGVRFFNDESVFRDLKMFIDNNVKQVKFIDRTFNCNKKHALKIWRFLADNDNGVTNFHFEISADLLDNETIGFLKTVRKGLFQFEIGVQSANLETLKEVNRNCSLEKLAEVVKEINSFENMHLHLDLIAGLPKEDYKSFKNSYNFVYNLAPDQLQLGFLKLLKGSDLRGRACELGLVFSENPPYEILFTKELTFSELARLKKIADLTEKFYNSRQFVYCLKYLNTKFESPFGLMECICDFFDENGYFGVDHSKFSISSKILEFHNNYFGENNLFTQLLIHDLLSRDNLRSLPEFLDSYSICDSDKRKIVEFYDGVGGIIDKFCTGGSGNGKEIDAKTHALGNRAFAKKSRVMAFDFDFETYENKKRFALYDYTKRDYNNNCYVYELGL